MKNAIIVFEEVKGFVCAAKSMRAAYVYLIEQQYILPDMDIYLAETNTWTTLEEVMGFKNPSKADMLDFVMTVDTDFWECNFYFCDNSDFAEREEVEWEVTIHYAEGGDVNIKVFEDKNDAFRFAAKVIAFSDCSDEHVDDIRCGDKHYHYTGWQPGMVMEFADEDGDIVYSICRPDWDH